MNKANMTKAGSTADKKTKVKFEETNEGQMLLNSISAAFHKVRKENQYIGETRIMQNLTKKSQFTEQKSDGEVAKLMKKKSARNNETGNENILPQVYRNTGFIRTSLPKNQ